MTMTERRPSAAGALAAGAADARTDAPTDAQAAGHALVERLDALLGEVAEAAGHDAHVDGPILVSASVPAPMLDATSLALAAASLGLEPGLFLQPAACFAQVAIGCARRVEARGDDRFAQVAADWAHLLESAFLDTCTEAARGCGPVLVGGVAFEASSGGSPDWAGFGAGSLVLPEIGFVVDEGEGRLTGSILLEDAADANTAGYAAAERIGDTWSRLLAAIEPSDDGDESATQSGAESTMRVVDELPADEWQMIAGRLAGAVGRGRVDKVVLARRVVLEAEREIDPGVVLRRLAGKSPRSTLFAFFRGDAVFLGATPERLVSVAGSEARTAAIAGSIRRGSTEAEDLELAAALRASEKDREEHVVVVRIMHESLRAHCSSLEIDPEPAVVRLPTVQHLVTEMRGTLRDRAGILELVSVLHPTPAVGGAPRDLALELIREQEGFDRGWYASPVGWLDAHGDGEFVVALRSGIIRGRSATLFAGCGIVADSDPEREWEESEMKLRALGSALGRIER